MTKFRTELRTYTFMLHSLKTLPKILTGMPRKEPGTSKTGLQTKLAVFRTRLKEGPEMLRMQLIVLLKLLLTN